MDILETGLLTLIVFVPSMGTLGLMVLSLFPLDDNLKKLLVRWIALGVSLIEFVLAVYLFVNYDQAAGGYQFVERQPWFALLGSEWHLGVDGISVVMVLLTGILMPLAILISFEIEKQSLWYMVLFLFLETGMMGVFVSLDLVVFFVFWEIGLVPMYFLINFWGGERRQYASVKFMVYTIAGSLGLLLAIQIIGITTGTMDIEALVGSLAQPGVWFNVQAQTSIVGIDAGTLKNLAFLAFFVAFAIKIPVWPFHTWLPDAHTEAPTAGSMILAGVLLKLGAYGFVRLVIPLFPAEAAAFAPIIAFLAVMGIVLGAFAAYAQNDFKRLVAYSSVNHMGFVVLGIAVMALAYGTAVTAPLTPESTQDAVLAVNGAVLQMFNHGLSAAGMFLLVGAIYHKAHTRDLRRMGGFWVLAPVYGGLLIFTSMASLGLPGLNGFVSEFLIVRGAWPVFTSATAISMIGLLFTGAYILKGLRMVLHGKPAPEWVEYDKNHHRLEISLREGLALTPLVVLMLFTGLLPNWILPMINGAVTTIFGG